MLSRFALPGFVLAIASGVAWFLLVQAPVKSPASGTADPAAAALVAMRSAPPLTVPNVTGEPLVAAKVGLEQAGLAWEVVGPVPGYHANVVISQSPPAGSSLIDTGAPLVTLRLSRSGAQTGVAVERSEQLATEARIYGGATTGLKQPAKAAAKVEPTAHVATPATKDVTHVAPKPTAPAPTDVAVAPIRPPAFIVPGARKEKARIVKRWLRQNWWIVDGARYGWWHGEQALVTLIAVDEQAQKEWGVGAKSAAIARKALRFVRAREAAQR
jgi:hypothetical protein